MIKLWIVLINNRVADKKLTQSGAMMKKRSLELAGYTNVSVAYEVAQYD